MFIDAHIHLIDEQELKLAQKMGVKRFIINATHPDNWDQIINFASKNTGVYPCIGVHPWFCDNLEDQWAKKLEEQLKKYPNLMVGEIGLDAEKNNFENQIKVFENCLELAIKYNRQVHIHGHKSWDKIEKILRKYPNITCLCHRFNGSKEQVQKLLKYNTYFSIMNDKTMAFLPKEKILVETDAPDGLKTPKNIIHLVEKLKLDTNQIVQNFNKFINIEETRTDGKKR